MKLSDEDTSKVMCQDLPETDEYSQIIYDAQDTGKQLDKDFKKSQETNNKAWSGIRNLMGKCIARGMRLEREQWIMALKRKGVIVTEPSQLQHIWIATLGGRRKRPDLVISDEEGGD